MKRNLASLLLFHASFVLAPLTASAAPITVPTGLNPGDQYRLAFVTSTTRDATSSNIADYNAFVTAAANSVPQFVALGTTWHAIGSTAAVAARDNTNTNFTVNPSGQPIYNLKGTLLSPPTRRFGPERCPPKSLLTKWAFSPRLLLWSGPVRSRLVSRTLLASSLVQPPYLKSVPQVAAARVHGWISQRIPPRPITPCTRCRASSRWCLSLERWPWHVSPRLDLHGCRSAGVVIADPRRLSSETTDNPASHLSSDVQRVGTLLLRPDHSSGESFGGLAGYARHVSRGKGISEKAKPTTDPAHERLVEVLLQLLVAVAVDFSGLAHACQLGLRLWKNASMPSRISAVSQQSARAVGRVGQVLLGVVRADEADQLLGLGHGAGRTEQRGGDFALDRLVQLLDRRARPRPEVPTGPRACPSSLQALSMIRRALGTPILATT